MSLGERARSQLSDEEIVLRFKANADAQFFAELFSRNRKRIYMSCRGFFNEGSAAEDATQETFLRAFQNIGRFDGGCFAAWLTRIAKNVCIDQWRKRKPEVETAITVSDSEVPNTNAFQTPSHGIAILREALEGLPTQQRRCLELKIEGFSYEETAVQTGMSIDAVKSHLQNGRRRLWLKMGGTVPPAR